MKVGLPLIKNVLIPLTAANAGTDRKILGSGATTLIISDEEIEYIMKIVKYLKDSGLSIKDIIQQSIKNEAKRWIPQYSFRYNWCLFVRK